MQSGQPNEYPFLEMRDVQKFVGEKVHLAAYQELADYPGLARSLDVRVVESVYGGLVFTMTGWCLSGKIPTNTETETVRWPRDWWQMFKKQYAPRWFTQRWPVIFAKKEVTTMTNHYFVCPHLVTDPNDRHVQFMAIGSPMARNIHPR